MIISSVVAAAIHAAYEVEYCVRNGIPIPEPIIHEPPKDNSANSPWMWLPMLMIGLMG